MTLRRLWVLLRGMPDNALWRLSWEAEIEKALTSPERNRERAAYYDRMREKEGSA